VTIKDVCGVVTNEVGAWCCPTATPTIRIPTVTPTATITPTRTPTRTPTPTPTLGVCTNCQYQTDLFWGPVIESFNGGVRYSTLNRLVAARSNFTNYRGCVLEPAPRLPAPVVAPMPTECQNPMSKGLLTGSIDTSGVNIPNGYIKGKVTNKSSTCTYDVGLASYKASGSNIDTQNLFDYKTQKLGPGETVEFVVKSPMINDEISCHRFPTITPTLTPTRGQTITPTRRPTVTPTRRPTVTPTRRPTAVPTICVEPTVAPPVCIYPTRAPKRCYVPTPSQSTKECSVSFDLKDTAVCWAEPRTRVPMTFTVHSLPSTGGPFYVQTDWYLVEPENGPHHYDWSQLAEVGKTYTIYADWAGIPEGSKDTVENHAGVNIVDKNGNPISPECTGGLDYYWTPYVSCPSGLKTVNGAETTYEEVTATPTPTKRSFWQMLFGF